MNGQEITKIIEMVGAIKEHLYKLVDDLNAIEGVEATFWGLTIDIDAYPVTEQTEDDIPF